MRKFNFHGLLAVPGSRVLPKDPLGGITFFSVRLELCRNKILGLNQQVLKSNFRGLLAPARRFKSAAERRAWRLLLPFSSGSELCGRGARHTFARAGPVRGEA
jgi:hypothetical protein